MYRITKSLMFLPLAFYIYPSQEKQLVKLNDKGCLSVVQARDVEKIVADYLENKWEIDKVIKAKDSVNQAKFSPDGKYIACATRTGIIKIFGITGKQIKVLDGDDKSLDCIDYSPDGKSLVSGSSVDKTVKLWDLSTGLCKKTIDDTGAFCVKFSADGNFIALGDEVLDLKNDYRIKLHDKTRVLSVAFSQVSNKLASTDGGTINIWSYNQNISPYLTDIIPTSDIQKLIMDYSNEFVLLNKLNGHTDNVNCLDFSPDGKYLASGSRDNTIKIWDIKTGNCIKTLEADECIFTIAFSLDGNYVISGATKYNEQGMRHHGRIKIWDINTGNYVQDFNYSKHFGIWMENINSIECQRGCILSTSECSCVILKNERFNALYDE